MTLTQIAAYLDDLCHQAGKIMLGARNDAESSVSSKSGSSNFVTKYDVAIQEHLISRIKARIPDAVFLVEEQENDASVLMGEHCFIIDPIDGTSNFIHDYSNCCVSIAMVSRGEAVLGAIYDPYRNELYMAQKGKGATLNGKPIRVSDRPVELAVSAFGTSPYYKDTLADDTFALAKEVFLVMADVRRCGSAALDFAHVAAGRIESFFECILSPWDFAAGALIVAEAGGIVTQFDGSSVDFSAPCSILAGTRNTHPTLLALAEKVKNQK